MAKKRDPLLYKKGYKIQVFKDISIKTKIKPPKVIRARFITLTKAGTLTVHDGYASDGSSGPTIQTKNTVRGAVFHDALYELMRLELLDQKWRIPADELIRELLLEDGMWEFRAWYWYEGLQLADGKAALPENRKQIFEAP